MLNTELKPFYAVVPLSLEELFAKELKTLGIEKSRVEKGGCWFGATFDQMMKVNLESRYASRILWKIAEGQYKNEEDIYKLALGVPWEEYFTVRDTFKIEIYARRCPLRSLDFLTLKIKDAVADRFTEQYQERPSISKTSPKIRIYAYVNEKTCTLYLDTSGESLFKRGWREEKGEAPLKENLAAGLLGLADWTPDKPLYDPFCGSGTIVIEAATIAANIAPGLYRRFGFENFKGFDSNRWQEMKKEARMAVDFDKTVNLAGSDISTLIVDRAEKNARLANLGKWLDSGNLKFFARDARQAAPLTQEPGLIVTNPPYGEQSNPKSASVPDLMRDFAEALKKNFAGWIVWMLTSDRRLPRQMHLKETRKIVFFNGSIECRDFRFVIVSGNYDKSSVEKTVENN